MTSISRRLAPLTWTLVSACILLSACKTDNDAASLVESATEEGGQSANRVPSVSGSPATGVLVGERYAFTPSASDPDGNPLQFTIDNAPEWADFDKATGRLSGTPQMEHVGLYESIRITVSDGALAASLPEFSISVTQTGVASVTLSWTPPTQNEDGTNLVDLAGYVIYYGRESGQYSHQLHIDNPGISSYVVENLVPDTYYFASTAINVAGVQSDFSNEISKLIN